MIRRGLALAVAATTAAALAGCAQPQAAWQQPRQLVIQVTPEILPVVNEPLDAALPDFAGDVGVTPVRLGSGDVVAITIIEPSGGGLYTPLGAAGASKITSLPAAQIDADGCVTMPFAGKIAIGGLAPPEAAGKLQASLARLAIRPQVQLTLVSSATRTVLVQGAVAHPGPQQIPPGGLLLQDAIAAAGGPIAGGYDTMIELDRAGTANSMRWEDFSGQPVYNVNLRGGDRVVLALVPHRITLLGQLARQNDRLPEQGESLAQAVAQAPNASSAYLLRQEPRDTALRIAALITKQQRQAATDTLGNALANQQPVAPTPKLPDDGTPIAVSFHFNPSTPVQLLLAAQIPLRDGDVVLVPDKGEE